MKLVWHILRKDLWLVRFHLLVLVAGGVAAYTLMLQVVPSLEPGESWEHGSNILALYFALWISVIPAMLQTDAPTGTTEFWMTRPIPKISLFVAKAFGVLSTVVLLSAGHALFLFTQGCQAAQIISIEGGLLANLAKAGVFAFLIASLTSGLGRFWLVLLALGLGGILGFSVFGSENASVLRELVQTRWNLWFDLTALGSLALVGFQYRHRQITRSWIAAVGLIASVSLLAKFWPWSLALLQESRSPNVSWTLQIENQGMGGYAATAFPPPVMKVTPPTGSVARITAITGTTVWSDERTTTATGASPKRYLGRIAAVERALGSSYSVVETGVESEIPIEILLLPRFGANFVGADDLRPTRFDGVLHGEQVRYFMMGTLPLNAGAAVVREGCKLVILQSPLGNPARWLVVKYQRPHYPGESSRGSRRPLLVLVNPTLKEARLLPAHGQSEHVAERVPGLDLIALAWSFSSQENQETGKTGYVFADDAWLAGAELWVFGERFEGSAVQAFAGALIEDGGRLSWTLTEPLPATPGDNRRREPIAIRSEMIETSPSP